MDLTETVRRCKEGDRNAFGLLYQATLESMRKVVLKYAEDQDMAEDVLHDGYLVALTSIDSLKDPSKVEGWLAVIMKNLALQELKSRKVRAADDISGLEVADADADDVVDRRLSMEDLDRIMDDLPDGYGKVFRLSVLEGLSHKEIGERLGIAPNSSSSQLFRAKVMMRRLVWQYSQRLGVVFAIAAIVGVAWYVLVKESPVEDLNVPLRNGVSQRNDSGREEIPMEGYAENESANHGAAMSSTSRTHQVTASVSSSAVDRIKDSEGEGNPELGAVGNNENAPENQPVSETVRDKSSDNIIDIGEIENGYEEQGYADVLNQSKTQKRAGWSLSFACSETFSIDYPFKKDDMDGYWSSSENPSDDPVVEDPSDNKAERCSPRSMPSYSTVHHVPMVFELSLEKRISTRFAIETGLRYTYLRTDYITEWKGLDLMSERRQMTHYLGIPLKLKFRVVDFNRFSLYLQGGGAIDVPVYGINRYIDSKGASAVPFSDKTEHINAPVQWSVEGGLGLQYRLAPHVGLYVEPSLKYYFDTNSRIETIRQENPLNMAIPIGIRFSW